MNPHASEPPAASSLDAGRSLSRASLDAIGAEGPPVVRNLRITQAYHELALATARATGPGANWCAFATWASKQAGQSIRGDDLDRKIEEAFAGANAVQRLVERVRDLRRAAGRDVDASEVLSAIREACAPLLITGRVADAVARGNKKVFDEIAHEFGRFVALLDDGADEAAIERFCTAFRPGDPPDGQRLLADAFRDYQRARATSDAKARAERLFLANIRIGLHEQTRLQPEITEALDAPLPDPEVVKSRLVAALFPSARPMAEPLRHLVRGALDEIGERFLDRLRAIVREAITEELMTLALPDRTLHLGRDLTGSFPPHLATLADVELVDFLRAVDCTVDTLRGTGARDWASLPERIHFIVDLFRLQHENPALFQAPFTAEQLQAIAAGRTPDGRL